MKFTGPFPTLEQKILSFSFLLGPGPFGPGPVWARAQIPGHLGPGSFGPGPVWTQGPFGPGPKSRAHLGPGPFGPKPIWARARLGPGLFGPRPVWPGIISLSGPIQKLCVLPAYAYPYAWPYRYTCANCL